MLDKTTLVLGAGGPWGVAWMSGLVLGLQEAGIDVRDSQTTIGSSAGAMLGAKLGSGVTQRELFEEQTSVESLTKQLSVFQRLTPLPSDSASSSSPSNQMTMLSVLSRDWDDDKQRIQAICDLALNAKTVSWEQFSAVMIPTPLSDIAWPAPRMKVTAIDVDAKSLQTFDVHSGVKLSHAVLASCAIPGIWPPVPIHNHRYIDGGSWGSGDNAHLAAGAGSVLIISPMAAQRMHRISGAAVLEKDIQQLRAAGARVQLIVADEASLASRTRSMLDPASMKAAAEAGRAQGLYEATAVRTALG